MLSVRHQELYNKINKVYEPLIKEFDMLLPYNPLVAEKALSEISASSSEYDSSSRYTFKETAEFFESDPGLFTIFITKANDLIKTRKDLKIRNLEMAIAMLGGRKTVYILQEAMLAQTVEQLESLPFKDMEYLWLEAWYMAFSCQILSIEFDVAKQDAFYIGLLSNIGHFIAAKIYKREYFEEIKEQNMKSLREGEILFESVEKEKYSFTHGEIGFWFLKYLNLSPHYYLAAIDHEKKPESHLTEIENLLSISNQISKYFLSDVLMNYYYSEGLPTELEEKIHIKRLRLKKKIFAMLNSTKGLSSKESQVILDRIDTKYKNLKEAVYLGKGETSDALYLDAFKRVGKKAKAAFAELLNKMEREIIPFLPFPLAVDLSKLQRGSLNYESFSQHMHSILHNFTGLMSSIILSYAHSVLKDDFYDCLDKIFSQGKIPKSSSRLSLGSGLFLSRDIFLFLNGKGIPIPSFIKNYIRNIEAINDLCRKRAQSKSSDAKSDLTELSKNLMKILRCFTDFKPKIVAVTDLDWDEDKEKYIVEKVSWMGLEDIESRPVETEMISRPVSKGQLVFYSNKDKPLLISKFVKYGRCSHCRKNHFYLADSIWLTETDICIKLRILNPDDSKCALNGSEDFLRISR